MDDFPFKSKDEFISSLPSLLNNAELTEDERSLVFSAIEQAAIQKARGSFYDYVLLMGPILVPEFISGRHIEKICAELQDVYNTLHTKKIPGKKQYNRKAISLPPGASKSQLVTRLFPSWVIGKAPFTRIIIVGHGINFATDEYGFKIRDILRSAEYQAIFPNTTLREDKATAGRFLTTFGGEVVCTGIEAKIAGRRAHLIITDDAIVEEAAYSKDVREKLVKNYPSNIRTRLLMNVVGGEILVGTRWCRGDLHDHMIEQDKLSGAPWDVIQIPALLTPEASEYLRQDNDPEGYLMPDTSFWPEFQPTEALKSLRKSLTNDISRWNAVYMQCPTAVEGSIIKQEEFMLWEQENPPPFHTVLVSMDTAYTKGTTSDYSAYVVLGLFKDSSRGFIDNNVMVIDWEKDKCDVPELLKKISHINSKYTPDFFLIENKASGLAIIPELTVRGYPVYPFKSQKDKITRGYSAAPTVRAGKVWLFMPEDGDKRQSNMEFISEITEFPNGLHDDVFDAFSQAIIWLKERQMVVSEGLIEGEFSDRFDDDLLSQNDGWNNSTYASCI